MSRHRRASLFAEEVLVQPFEFDRAVAAHADAVFDHEIGELLSVDQVYPSGQMLDIVSCRLAESGRGNEHSLGRT